MKALISPNEVFSFTYIEEWDENFDPIHVSVSDAIRVAEISETGFEVAGPLFWLDCPEDCEADTWYYKDGNFYKKPEDKAPPTPVEDAASQHSLDNSE